MTMMRISFLFLMVFSIDDAFVVVVDVDFDAVCYSCFTVVYVIVVDG